VVQTNQGSRSGKKKPTANRTFQLSKGGGRDDSKKIVTLKYRAQPLASDEVLKGLNKTIRKKPRRHWGEWKNLSGIFNAKRQGNWQFTREESGGIKLTYS